jgi:16S rRNA (guanine966-N2)-methyltransferase
MIRITAGKYKNKKIEVPEDARPVTERQRINIFDLLSDIIEDTTVLDLYAGSGIMGIEALSRKAKKAVFIDSSKDSIMSIKTNLKNLPLKQNQTQIINNNVWKSLNTEKKLKDSFDIVFVDPPFKSSERINLKLIGTVLKPNGIIMLRLPKNYFQSDIRILKKKSFEKIIEKVVGTSSIVFYREKV